MFNNIPEFFSYMNGLRKAVDEHLEYRKKKLDYKCEACKNNPIELEYAYENYCVDYFEDGVKKTKINCHFFCKSCYKKIIETEQLPKSRFMKDIDREIFGE